VYLGHLRRPSGSSSTKEISCLRKAVDIGRHVMRGIRIHTSMVRLMYSPGVFGELRWVPKMLHRPPIQYDRKTELAFKSLAHWTSLLSLCPPEGLVHLSSKQTVPCYSGHSLQFTFLFPMEPQKRNRFTSPRVRGRNVGEMG
jgi:hypothetical protein